MRIHKTVSLGVTFGVVASCSAVALAAAALLGACDDEHRRSTLAAGGAGACSAPAGEFPSATCDPSDNVCNQGGTCAIDTKSCGALSCLPMADNTGSVLDFRLRRLNVIAPAPLTHARTPLIQDAVINSAIDLNAKQCGEIGKGSFTWLLRIDTGNGLLITGGAPPAQDPFGEGFCFFQGMVKAGAESLPVQPVRMPMKKNADGAFESEKVDKLYVPIFTDNTGSSVIVLPLTKARMKDVAVSPDGNCIGSLNPAALPSNCEDIFGDCSKWHTAGALGGHITLEEADAVYINELNRTLCVTLTDTAPDTKCARDAQGHILAKGDYCSATDSPGGCADSFWMAATFAAAAVKINDGTSTPACHGSLVETDAGADASSDAAADAGTDGGRDASSDAGADAPSDAADSG